MKWMETRPQSCPACQSDRLRHFDYCDSTIHLCDRCRLQWADRVDASQWVNEGNSTGVYGHYMDPRSFDPQTHPPFVKFFEELAEFAGGRKLRLLDVGCGNGVFVAEALRRGIDACGVELNPDLEAMMPREVAARVVFTTIEEYLSTQGGPYDVVTFWDSFEHLDDPFAVLRMVQGCLAEDGRVFVRTNNCFDVFNLTTVVCLRVLPASIAKGMLRFCFNAPGHAWNFSERGMERLLEASGWRATLRRVTETPSGRLTSNVLARLLIETAYVVNRAIGGGKIAEYWLQPRKRAQASASMLKAATSAPGMVDNR